MNAPRKLRVATTSLAGCFGCHMSFLDIDERLLQLLEQVDFDRSPLTAARANAAALTASLEMTARRLVTRGPFMRWCRCCEEVRDAHEFEDDGACVRCHIDLASIAAEQHAAARAAVEADLETWPVEPPALVWNSDADEELSAEVECPACHGHGDVPSGRHSAHDPLGLATCKRCGGDGVIARASLHAEPACAEVA